MGGCGFPMAAAPLQNHIGNIGRSKEMDINIYALELEETNPKAHQFFCQNFYYWMQSVMEANQAFKDMGDTSRILSLDDIQERMEDWIGVLNQTQSPIEEILAAGLLFSVDGYQDIKFDWFPGSTQELKREGWGAVFSCQGHVETYRPDFVITCYCNGREKQIAIECDGHDFHEKTKQQAQRDKARDRVFAKKGITLLRFTGSEIYKDPRACIEEIESVVNNELEDLMHLEGLINRRIRK